MQFTRLRVLGFKSFVEPTEFLIEPGLTGVVGPNGCGKSNLVEALRWVMGEASYKNMRASGMDDVIFSGSTGRPARNTAEVSLAADNSDRTAPAGLNDDDTLEITRRIEREAGSVYKINGKDVRARDVQLLFADASTGAHSPAMVGQGRIGELIAAKPTDRRKLLEEAAGISGLHNRRHEAELRLKAAETNLSRLDDVIGEIETQLDALKRQARQAVRYRNLSGDIRRAESTVFHLRWRDTKAALAEAEATLKETSGVTAERQEAQAEAAKIQAQAAALLPELRDAAAGAAAAVQRIKLAQEALDAEQARVTERLAAIDRHLSQLDEDIGRERRMVEENHTILERLDTEEHDLESANASTVSSQETANRQREVAATALEESETRLGTLTAQHAEITARRNQIVKTVADAERRIERLNGELTTLRERIAALAASGLGTDELEARQMAVGSAGETVEAAEAAVAGSEEAHITARDGAVTAREAVGAAEQSLGRIETEMSTLAAILAADQDGEHTPVMDAVKVDSGYEAALGAAFGDELDAPLDEGAAAHWRAIGRHGQQDLPTGAEPLAQHVQAPEALANRLAQTGVVSRETGKSLQSLLRPGQRLVSREGDMWRWDGYVAAADSNQAAAQRLASRNRLAELETELEPAQTAVGGAKAALEQAQESVRTASETERDARDGLRQARRDLDQAREALAKAERESSRIAAQRSALDEAVQRIEDELSEAAETLTSARGELEGAADPAGVAAAIETARGKVQEDRTVLAEARATVENLTREAELRSGRLAAIAVERQNWRQRGANAEKQIETLTGRRGDLVKEQESLADVPAEIEAKRRALLSEASTAETARAEAADRLADGEAVLKEADTEAREALENLSQAREQRGRAEERVTASKARQEEIARQIAEALDCAPHEVFALTELKPDAPLPALADTEARLERYKRERERLGAVNLRADVEATEMAERRDALTGERDDLIAAIQRLRQGIASLNREGRERLLAAFETVDGHFRNLFTHLFGGGQAELQLTESDDPLQAGLEILARPPGKKPQIMTLLSGGEQALTAMSLIFAVFLTNPAPLCVLDEVDAPLDDANVERFCNLLDQMNDETDTRFVVITHNPITMARMNRLFGVTMAERGVSQLVSVDLETAESFREAG